jgi:hypothetical protein
VSRRFVEGLTEADVEGVTLVVEPKVNATVTELFPGRVRMIADKRLDQIMGLGLARPMGSVPAGATVAHLSHGLARHMGCDPVILVGQDLGFSDGQYYSAGAAIHEVWAGELGPFNTLEMMEWQRIVRLGGGQLRRLHDNIGRTILADAQMTAYLQQFETRFQQDAAAGLRTIDASIGGTAKRHTEVMSIDEAVRTFAGDAVAIPSAERTPDVEGRLASLRVRISSIREDVAAVARQSRRAGGLLEAMRDTVTNHQRFNALVDKLHRVRDDVEKREPGYGLVQFASQTGQMKRLVADRKLRFEKGLGEIATRKRELERDAVNVVWLAEAAESLLELLDNTLAVLDGTGGRITLDHDAGIAGQASSVSQPGNARRVGAVLMFDPLVGGLGQARDAAAPVASGRTALSLTVERLLGTKELDRVIVACGDPGLAWLLLGDIARSDRVSVVGVDGARVRERARRVGVARLWSPAAWRGGIANMTVYDESLDPCALRDVIQAEGLDAAVVASAEGCLVDPALIEDIVRCYRRHDGAVRIAFSQAVPGLGGFLIDAGSVVSMAEALAAGSSFASIGGVVGFVPTVPQADPIAREFCRGIPTAVRDCGERVIADTPSMRARVASVIARLGSGWVDADSERVIALLAASKRGGGAVRDVTLELCTGRLGGGVWARRVRGAWGGEDADRGVMTPELAERLLRPICTERPDVALTLDGAGDPMLHPGIEEIIAAARAAGVCGVHVRTDMLSPSASVDRVMDLGVDVVSVDVLATEAATHRVLTGTDRFDAVVAGTEELAKLAAEQRDGVGIGLPWIVPRITRSDEVYEQIECFYNAWLMVAGAAVIDPLPGPVAGARITPLPVPDAVARRRAVSAVVYRSDGSPLRSRHREDVADVAVRARGLGVSAA